MIAITQAAQALGSWRLDGCVLYATLEPCPMCAGAVVQARIPMVVYGCADPKAGACETLYQIASDGRLNHRAQVVGGVLAEQCATLLTDFFAAKRGSVKSDWPVPSLQSAGPIGAIHRAAGVDRRGPVVDCP